MPAANSDFSEYRRFTLNKNHTIFNVNKLTVHVLYTVRLAGKKGMNENIEQVEIVRLGDRETERHMNKKK